MKAKINVLMAWKDFSKKIKLKQSFLLACFLVISGYFMNNLPLFMGENSVAIHLAQIISQKIKREDVATDNVIYIDVGYDLQLVDYNDYYHGIISGNIAITDREKLCCLLDMLKRSGYKYIILDVLFEPYVTTPSDSALYERISSMDRIVVAEAPGVPVVDELKDKACLVDYMVTALSDGYSKDEFLRPYGFCWGGTPTQDKVSLPLKVYEDLASERKFRRYGCGKFSVYVSGSRLCYNSVFPQLSSLKCPVETSEVLPNSGYCSDSYYMGDMLSMRRNLQTYGYTDDECLDIIFPKDMSEKVVVIGCMNMMHDTHETSAGEKSGGQLLYEAYRSLENGQHIVSWWQAIFWFFMYLIIGCVVLSGGVCVKPTCPVQRTILYLFGLVSFSSILIGGQAICYVYGVYVPSVCLPILCFSIAKMYVDFKKL